MDLTRSCTNTSAISSPVAPPSNAEIAELLDRVSGFLRAQEARAGCVRTWARAASIVRRLDRDARDVIAAEGPAGLAEIVPRVALAIDEIVRTRGLALLARLEGDLGPEALFTTSSSSGPSVEVLLEADARYRELAERRKLPRVAPCRFNPRHEAWLPVLHDDADGFHLHVMFENTARAHELGCTHDWVVIFADHEGVETRHTVVTERRGASAGRRVVRGREAECIELASTGT